MRFPSRGIAFIVFSFALAGCGPSPDEQSGIAVQHHKSAKAHHEAPVAPATASITADAYLLQLSLAKLALAGDSPDTTSAAPHLSQINAYASQNPKSPFFQPAVILTYTTDAKKSPQRVLAPFTMPQETHDFPALIPILDAMATTSYTLQDITPAVVVITGADQALPATISPEQAQKTIDRRLLMLSQNPGILPPLESAQLQMQLTRFFMEHRIRDAAYLCLENARQSLGRVSEGEAASSETVREHSQQLDALADELHKTMPFSLTAF